MFKRLFVLIGVVCLLLSLNIRSTAQDYPILWEDHFEDDDPPALLNVGWIYYPENDVAGQIVEQRDGTLFVQAGTYGGIVGVGLVETNGLPQITLDEDGNIDSTTIALALEDKWSSPNQILTFRINFARFSTSNFFVGTRMPIDTSRGDADPTEAAAYTLVLSPLQDMITLGKYEGPMAALAPDTWTYFMEPMSFDFDLEVFYWVKWYLKEGDIKVKIWEGEEADEPSEWMAEVVDSEPRVTGTYTMFAAMGAPPQPDQGDQFILDDIVMRSSIEGGVAIDLKDGNSATLAKDFQLDQNFPNPFNPATTISFRLGQQNQTKLVVYNVNGQIIRTLVDGVMAAGTHAVEWDGLDDQHQPVSSGVYIYRLTSGDQQLSRRMVFMK